MVADMAICLVDMAMVLVDMVADMAICLVDMAMDLVDTGMAAVATIQLTMEEDIKLYLIKLQTF